jgi:hypothetical protein
MSNITTKRMHKQCMIFKQSKFVHSVTTISYNHNDHSKLLTNYRKQKTTKTNKQTNNIKHNNNHLQRLKYQISRECPTTVTAAV